MKTFRVADSPEIRAAYAEEAQKQEQRGQYYAAYAEILGRPDMREMRQHIQELYQEAAHQGKLASDAQRAAAYGYGQVSVIGRSVEGVRQGNADYQAGEAQDAWSLWSQATARYEAAIREALTAASVPIELFRPSSGHGLGLAHDGIRA